MQQLAPWCAAAVVGVFSGCAAAALARRLFLAAAVTLLLELWNLPWSWSRAAFLNAPTTTVSCALARQVKHWERAELTYWMSLCCAKRATFRWMSKILRRNRGFVLERLTFDWPITVFTVISWGKWFECIAAALKQLRPPKSMSIYTSELQPHPHLFTLLQSRFLEIFQGALLPVFSTAHLCHVIDVILAANPFKETRSHLMTAFALCLKSHLHTSLQCREDIKSMNQLWHCLIRMNSPASSAKKWEIGSQAFYKVKV